MHRTTRPLAVLTSLFFLWGFITVLNDVLVPHWKQLFALTHAQSLLVQFCFFGAYFIGSLAYYLISVSSGDPIARLGYKRGLIVGLLISAAGCALFAPASLMHSYAAHLVALFVLGIGFTVLQIAANPFVAIIGDPEGASSRLNLAQAFNSLGTTLAPLIGGALIFQHVDPSAAVRLPYLGLAGILVLMAVVVRSTALPSPPPTVGGATGNAWQFPQLRRGMLAIFCYVGAEVAIGSLLIAFAGLDTILGLPEADAKHYLSLYWGGAMTGRFLGAVALNERYTRVQRLWTMLAVGTGMFILLILLNGGDRQALERFWPLAPWTVLNMLVLLLVGPRPARAMALFAAMAVVLLLGGILGSGAWALWCLLAIGLFNSIMWSNIFTLSIEGLGDSTAQGSSLLVMMILGGALVPWAQGVLIDLLETGDPALPGFQLSFLLPLCCYAYLVWFGMKAAISNPTRTE